MIYLGADHRGYELKEKITRWLFEWEYDFLDVGAQSLDPTDDYTKYASEVASLVAGNKGSKGIILCDTNAWATCLWHERYMGYMSDDVAVVNNGRKYDVYILTADDIPFVQDGTRDGKHIRHTMHERFEEELKKQSVPYIVVSGNHEKRMQESIRICDEVLKRNIFTEMDTH